MKLRVSEIDESVEVDEESLKTLMREDNGVSCGWMGTRGRDAKVERWRGNLYKKGQAG